MAKRITIDFGHGAQDYGAVFTGSFAEREEHQKLVRKEKDAVRSLHPLLEERFARVSLNVNYIGLPDKFVSLNARTERANQHGSDLFYSIHCNAANKVAHGIEMWRYKWSKTSDVAAHIALAELTKRFPDHNNRGVKRGNFHVLRETNMRAVLWELEFIDTEKGVKMLSDPASLELIADAIYVSALTTLDIEVPAKKQVSKVRRAIGRVEDCYCPCNH